MFVLLYYLTCFVTFILFLFNYTATTLFFFFNDPATTEIYTLSLHDALPIYLVMAAGSWPFLDRRDALTAGYCSGGKQDRKSTRLNSSHQIISYAVFCLKKKRSSTYLYLHTTKGTT